MIALRTHQKALVLGDFETGKTTLVRHLVSLSPKTLVFDPVWEYSKEGVHDLGALRAKAAQPGAAVFQPYDAETTFDDFCRLALGQTNTLVVIDEPSLVLASRSAIPADFNRLYRLGHKRGCGVVLATHRITGDLPALLRMNHHFFVFKTTIDNDLDTLREYIGDAGAAWVAKAPRFQFWHRGPDHEGPVGALPAQREKPKEKPNVVPTSKRVNTSP